MAKGKYNKAGHAKFMAPLRPTNALGEIVGFKPLPRTQAVKKTWAYIKKHHLQDKVKRQFINADDKLKAVVGKSKLSMFELTKQISKNLKKI